MTKEKRPKFWFEDSASREPNEEYDRSFERAEQTFSKPNSMASVLRFPEFRIGAIPVKMAETEKELLLKAELPGFSKEEIKLKVTPKLVYITAEKRSKSEDNRGGFFARSSTCKTTSRILKLPKEAKTDGVRARFRNSVLEVVIPKKLSD
jgi:HSP20 family molecular chaperone IbpA